MPIRDNANQVLETISEYEEASFERHLEGLELYSKGYFLGAIYLWGYVAEMLLKISFFRLLPGHQIYDPTQMGVARGHAQQYGIQGLRNYHELYVWLQLILAERNQHGMLPPPNQQIFDTIVQRLYDNWEVTLRYKSTLSLPINQNDAESFMNDIEWLRSNYQDLWR